MILGGGRFGFASADVDQSQNALGWRPEDHPVPSMGRKPPTRLPNLHPSMQPPGWVELLEGFPCWYRVLSLQPQGLLFAFQHRNTFQS